MHSGEVEAKVWYYLEKEENLIQEEKIATNETENKYGIILKALLPSGLSRLRRHVPYSLVVRLSLRIPLEPDQTVSSFRLPSARYPWNVKLCRKPLFPTVLLQDNQVPPLYICGQSPFPSL